MKNVDEKTVFELLKRYEETRKKENRVFTLIFILGFVLLVASIWLFTE